MTSLLGGRCDARVRLRPVDRVGSAAPEFIALAEACGVRLDGWQQDVLDDGLAERADGSWAASEVDLIASRQNGKNGVLEVRELGGVVLLNEWVIHTAHLFKTTMESFDRLYSLVEANLDVKEFLTQKVASPASGYSMRFRGGGRISFIARSRSSGRGLTGDLLVFDESQDLNDDAQGALLPTVSARPGAQVWYTGSAPGVGSVVWHRTRKRGRSGEPGRFAYFEYSADPEADLDDRAAWAQANPAFGVRITEEAIESERMSMSDEMFARERLSISPDLLEAGGPFGKAWAAVCDDAATAAPDVFAFDANPERSAAGIVVAGRAGPTIEVVDYRPGVSWLVARSVELWEKYRAPFVVDRKGPAGSFVPELESSGVRIIELPDLDLARACGSFFDAVMDGAVTVRTNTDLDAAVACAVQRTMGDQWAWGRRKSGDIALLMAATLALWEVAKPAEPSRTWFGGYA